MLQEKEVSIKDVLTETCGPDDLGFAKCVVGVFLDILDEEGKWIRRLDELAIEKPIVQLYRMREYTQIDFIFRCQQDVDLIMIWDVLDAYGKAVQNIEEGNYPQLTLQIAPKCYDFKYFVLAVNPIFFTLQPESPSAADCNVLRFVFNEENMTVAGMEISNEEKEEIHREVQEELQEDEL